MKQLPNGLKVFNATPHDLTFSDPSWEKDVTIPSDGVINAKVDEVYIGCFDNDQNEEDSERSVSIVTIVPQPDPDSLEVVKRAMAAVEESHRDYNRVGTIVVGSALAAQAWPELVYGICPAEGTGRIDRKASATKFTRYAPHPQREELPTIEELRSAQEAEKENDYWDYYERNEGKS